MHRLAAPETLAPSLPAETGQDSRRAPADGAATRGWAAPPATAWRGARRDEILPLAWVLGQFGLLVWLIRAAQLGADTAVGDLMQWCLGGFVIHHFLPRRFQMPFFAALSLGGLWWVTGGAISVSVALLGGLIVAVCHLPIRFRWRVAVVFAMGTVLAVWRARLAPILFVKGDDAFSVFWPVFGTMFMFRTIAYLYDLRHRAAPFGPFRAAAYFFMLPSACFPLFPLVDYKTFNATHFNERPLAIYQTGLVWMLRGAVQILLYRLVYQFAPLNVATLQDGGDAAWYMISMYALYLDLSGRFHLVVGLLHMFGFNLPETHHRYFLAASFTDLWRRINIYWKDFMMKVVFYPVYFRLRGWGPLRTLAAATAATFVATWFLHAYQWFWLRGTPLLTLPDVLFWTVLCALVVADALREAKRGRQRTLDPKRRTLRSALRQAWRTMATFAAMCVLWTFWSSGSLEDFRAVMSALRIPAWTDYALIAALLVGVGAAAMLFGHTTSERTEARGAAATAHKAFSWPSAALGTAYAASLLGVGFLGKVTLLERFAGEETAAAITSEHMNRGDDEVLVRGYYDELNVGRFSRIWNQRGGKPDDWANEDVFLRHDDFQYRSLEPSADVVNRGARMTTNRWGMRDRDYEEDKPAGTWRVAVLGSSHEMGAGVADDEVFDNVLEDRLNAEARSDGGLQYEFLNFSVEALTPPQLLYVFESRALAFEPDAVLLMTNSLALEHTAGYLAKAAWRGVDIPWPELTRLMEETGVYDADSEIEAEQIVRTHGDELLEWVLRRLADEASHRRLAAFVAYRPSTTDQVDMRESRRRLHELVEEAGLPWLDLSPAFAGIDRNRLILARWDNHTNALGHRRLANELYNQLLPHLPSPGLSGNP